MRPLRILRSGLPGILFENSLKEKNMRWLGLDLGEKRIGIALSDPLELTAGGYQVLTRTGSLPMDLEALKKLIEAQTVGGIVLGLPRNMNGSEGPAAVKVRDFGARLEKITGVNVVYWDEWLSTCSAQRVLLEADLSRRKRKGKIDQVAAVIILQNYLDAKNRIKESSSGKIPGDVDQI